MDPIRPVEPMRLTPGQAVLWASECRHAGAPLYNMAFSVVIDGAIDADVFKIAFSRLVGECEPLRTVLAERDGLGTQRVLVEADAQMSLVDLGEEPDPSAAFRRATAQRCETPMRLDTRTYDAGLYRLGPARWGWYLCQHHVVSDAWSAALLFRRLGSLYEALRDGTDAGPALPCSQGMGGDADEADAASRAHWARARGRDGGTAAPYGLRASVATTANTRVSVPLDPARSAALRELALQPGVRALTPDLTMFRLLTTATVTFLRRVCGTRSLVLGAPGHNRLSARARETVGLFTEVFPMVFVGDDDDTFETLHGSVVEETDLFLRHARPDAGDGAASRSIGAVLNMIRATFGPFAGMPTSTVWEHSGHVEPEHSLRVHVHDFDGTGELTLLFDCNDGVFEPHAREALVSHYLAVIDAMASSWSTRLDAVDLRGRDTIQAAEVREPEQPVDVVEAFEMQAAARPDAEAVLDRDRVLTYAALRDRALSLAAGLPSGARIGLCFGRSDDVVVAMLGTLMAGSTFVPLDPDWPAERLRFVIEDAGCVAVLADRVLSLAVPSVSIDGAVAGGLSGVDAGAPADGLAYILYTSGSTGRPKGVMIERASLSAYAGWGSGFYDRGERLGFPLFTQLTFDLTLTSIFVPLVSGGRIVVFPESSGDADLAVQAVFDDPRIEIVKLTPSHLALVEGVVGSSVRQLILGGEALLGPVARRAVDQLGASVLLHNEYGPTEATVGCVLHTYDPVSDTDAAVPIGRPVAGSFAVVLDGAGNLVPDGVAGELWVGGPGVARGYVGLDELTEDRFRTMRAAGGRRVYKTGDLARRRADGVLEYLGRIDDQVKLRGARIELGEVESAIGAHPDVRGVAAMVRTRRAAPSVRSERTCRRCGLPSSYPGTTYDSSGLCNQCRAFDGYSERARVYFKPMTALESLFAERASDPEATHDCIVLLSGGKDSTYMLARLADMGLRVLAFTLDNGYISDQAKANIRRVVDALGVDHVWGSTPAMDEIFVDSLQRHANVCHGCFKTIYTLSMGIARERRIPFIVTGLSRGQFFETRLTPDLFTELTVSVEGIDANVLETRKAYHRIDDAVRRCLDVSVFDDDQVFDDVRFVDFYRYCDVELEELYEYLDRRVPWARPTDTGRSTNCLINDVGIYVHKHVRGYHNYALPYSWDVRMGHKTREAALDELDDTIDVDEVQRILRAIGYPEDVASLRATSRLVAYYVSDVPLSGAALRQHAADRLPASMVPAQFVRVDEIPLSANGKIDRASLPEPEVQTRSLDAAYVPPTSEIEHALASIWQEVLGVDAVGVDDRFFDLGGDSIMAIQVVARASRRGIRISLAQLFEAVTISGLAGVATTAQESAGPVSGPITLLPAQAWAIELYGDAVSSLNHTVRLSLAPGIGRDRITRAIDEVVRVHDAFRIVFRDGVPRLQDPDDGPFWEWSPDQGAFDLGVGRLLRASLLETTDGVVLVLRASHMIVDAVSWGVIVDDLEHLLVVEDAVLPPVTTTSGAWGEALLPSIDGVERAFWLDAVRSSPSVTPDPTGSGEPQTIRHRFDRAMTARLVEGVAGWRIGIDELLLSALSEVIADGRDRTARVMVEGHGRESRTVERDATRTVGWLTSLYPVCPALPNAGDLAGVMTSVKETLRTVPRGGVGYGVLRYLDPDADVRGRLSLEPAGFVLFNFLGRVPTGTAVSDRCIGWAGPLELSRAAGTTIAYRAEVNAMIAGDVLVIDWTYDDGRASPDDAKAEFDRVIGTLVAMLDACEAGALQAPTASDFPLSNLDAAGLGTLASLLGSKGKKRS